MDYKECSYCSEDKDLDEFRNLTKDSKSENTWSIHIDEVNKETYELSVNNPNIDIETLPQPEEILSEIEDLQNESLKLFKLLKDMTN